MQKSHILSSIIIPACGNQEHQHVGMWRSFRNHYHCSRGYASELLPPTPARIFPPFPVMVFQEVAVQKYATLLNNCQVKCTYTHQLCKTGPGCRQAEKYSCRCVCVFLGMPISCVISQAKDVIFSQKNLNLVGHLLNSKVKVFLSSHNMQAN